MTETDAAAGQAPVAAPVGNRDEVAAESRRHSGLIAAGILLSRIAGFIRQRAIGHFFGLSFVTDAFNAAFKIPNLMQNLLGEGVLSASFIPVYSRLLSEGRDEEAGRVAGAIAGLLAMVAAALVLVGVLLADPLTTLVAPGLPDSTHDLTVTLMRIITPGIGFLVLSAWCLGVLNSHRRFFLSYVAPVIWNVAQIVALIGGAIILLDAPLSPGDATPETLIRLVEALAWGTLVGGLLQFLVQLPGVIRLTRDLRVSVRTDLPGVRRTMRAFGPVVAGRGVVQLMSYVDIMLASLLAAGAISALIFAQQLFILPISLFGMSVAAAELPALSSADATDRDSIALRLDQGLERIAFYVVPSALVFFTLGDLIVGALFRSGNFDRLDEMLVWLVLVGFSLGLLANTSSRLLQSALYGAGDTRTPAKIAALRVTVAASVGVLLMFQLDRVQITAEGFRLIDSLPAFTPLAASVRDQSAAPHLGAVGLAAAAGASSWIEYRLLRRTLERRIDRPVRAAGGLLWRTLAASGVAGVVALGSRLLVAGMHPIAAGAIALALTGITYLVAASALGLGEAASLLATVRARLPGSPR